MTFWPFLIGGLSGAILILSLYRLGALKERSGIAVLLGAIAFFWPVFAVQANAPMLTIVVHALVFVAFAIIAAYGFRQSAAVLAVGIIAHGFSMRWFWLPTILALLGGPPFVVRWISLRERSYSF